MNFTNLVELVQVFANEYCYPSSVVLVYGNLEEIELIKEQFKFITSELISMDTSHGKNVDIVVAGELLPFESHSFDLILSFKNIHGDFKRVLKPNGKLLTTGVIIDALDTYYYDNKVFSVI